MQFRESIGELFHGALPCDIVRYRRRKERNRVGEVVEK
jgi:hypothetical protein